MPNGGNRVSEQIAANAISFTIEKPLQSWIEASKILGVITEIEDGSGVQNINGFSYSFNISGDGNGTTYSYKPFSKMNWLLFR